jgi:ABC-type antimicrobial peptide transport system, ATPase component
MPYELSGGEQQRIAIAVALSNNPPLILADEPTGELDDETSQNILDLLNKLNQKLNTTIVIVTHDPKISNDVSRSITIKDGKTSLETQIINNEKNEYLLIDSIGSLQIPKKILDSNNIDKRVKIYNEGGVIKIEADNEK